MMRERLKINQVSKDLEQLRKIWGLEKLISPFITSKELDKFWEKRKQIEELELKLKKLKNEKD
tara:strand:- start:365 stop:553 length:189 start_codon:yes stop_codon:yes gene_type:complete